MKSCFKHGKLLIYLRSHRKGYSSDSVVKNPPAKQMWVPSLGWEDLLEEEMATQSSILVWEIPWTEEPGGLQYIRSLKSWM